MNDDTAATPTGALDLEVRLRGAMTRRAGYAPVAAADWGDLAGRLASATRRRQRMFVAGAALSLVIGAAGGYFGEAAASTGTTAARSASPSPSGTPATTVPGGRLAPSAAGAKGAPSVAGGPAAAALCPGATGADTGVGSATQVFVRTTADGVTVRVYRLATPSFSSCLPTPLPSGVAGSSTSSAAPGAAGGAPPASTPNTSDVPTIAAAPTFSIELSDSSAVGQGVVSSPQCVATPAAGATGAGGGSTSGSSSGSPGVGSTGSGTVAPEPVTPPGTVLPPVITTTVPPTGVSAATEPQQLSSGVFGVVEGDPVWWVAVQVGSDVSSVRMTFADGSVDQMAPVGGVAVVAHHVSAATVSAGAGPYEVRGTLELLAADGSTVASVTLPETPPAPTPVPVPAGAPSNPGSSTPSTGANGAGAVSSVPAPPGPVSSGPVSSGSGSATVTTVCAPAAIP